jgi:hypothetical protein
VQISDSLGAHMLHPPSPVCAEIIVAEAVLGPIDQSLEARLQGCPLCRIHLDLEYRELHALTVILASLCDAAQTSGAAQQAAVPVVGFMHILSPENVPHFVPAFRQGLKEQGFVEGQNLAVEYRWAHGQYDRLPELAADLRDFWASRREGAELTLAGLAVRNTTKAEGRGLTVPLLHDPRATRRRCWRAVARKI